MNPLRYVMLMGMALIVTAVLVPMGLQLIAEANLTGVNATVATVFTVLLPIMVILGLALAYMPPELKSKVGL